METYVVVGGGLAGLTAANALAGQGRKVTLIEQASHLGGRARTQTERGFALNFGPHALYRGGCAARTFKSWGVPFSGGLPPTKSRAYFVRDGQFYPLLTNLGSLLATRLFNFREKLEVASLLRSLAAAKASPSETMTQWLDRHLSSERVREFAATVIRISTFAVEFDQLSACIALRQVSSALKENVLYLDGGWQTLVDGLAERARSLEVDIRLGEAMSTVDSIDATGIVLAVSPSQVQKLTGMPIPAGPAVHLASLELGLKGMTNETKTVAFPLDRPLYLTEHSASAQLAPVGCRLVHVSKYLGSAPEDAKAVRAELEDYATFVVPGWRQHAELVRFLPDLTVTPRMPTLENRPDVDFLGLRRVKIAGDWVGPEGMLANCAVASALRAASSVLQASAAVAA